MQARIDGGEIQLLTRKGLDWTAKFKPVAKALKDLKIPSALLDGEIVVEDEAGVSSFSALQQELKGKGERFVYYVFDLLYLDGKDLRKAALADRKAALRFCSMTSPRAVPFASATISRKTAQPSSNMPAAWAWKASSRSAPTSPTGRAGVMTGSNRSAP